LPNEKLGVTLRKYREDGIHGHYYATDQRDSHPVDFITCLPEEDAYRRLRVDRHTTNNAKHDDCYTRYRGSSITMSQRAQALL